MQHHEVFPKKLIYLFSFDLDLGLKRGQCRVGNEVITSQTHDFTPGEAKQQLVYNALGEARVLGEEALTGHVEFAQDTIRYLPTANFADISGRFLILTGGSQRVEAEYEGVVRAGKSWFSVCDSYAQRLGDTPITTKAHMRLRFETGSTKYRWLVKYQCVGYGTMLIRWGAPCQSTFDIYALT